MNQATATRQQWLHKHIQNLLAKRPRGMTAEAIHERWKERSPGVEKIQSAMSDLISQHQVTRVDQGTKGIAIYVANKFLGVKQQ